MSLPNSITPPEIKGGKPKVKRTEISYMLSGYIQDPETGTCVNLCGASLKGTPLQVAMIFESLGVLPGSSDFSVINEEEQQVWRLGQDTLADVRRTQRDSRYEEYDDPHTSHLELPKTKRPRWVVEEYE